MSHSKLEILYLSLSQYLSLSLSLYLSISGIIFWRMGPLWYRLPLLSNCSRNPSVAVYQLVLWEVACGLSEFYWRFFQHICPVYDGWFTSALAHSTLSVQQFLAQNGRAPVPHPPHSPDLVLNNFFLFPHMQKVLKWKHFAEEEVKQTAEALKVIKINEFKNCFEQWKKNVSIGALHQMERTLKVTAV